MTKFAPVAPFHIYQQFLVNGYVPEQVLLLAHDVVAHADDYKETFMDPRWDNTNIIMDNSVVETGKAADLGMVQEAVRIVDADVIALPDVMGSAKDNLALLGESWDKWRWAFRDKELMALLQGSDIQDWFLNLETVAHKYQTPWIGVTRRTEGLKDPHTGKVYNRMHLVDFASRLIPNAKIHLFGFSDSLWEDLFIAGHSSVQSIDSAVPLRMKTDYPLSEKIGPRGDWWETAKFDPKMIDNCRKIDELITRLG